MTSNDFERLAESGFDERAGRRRVLLQQVSVRMPAVAEQRNHLLFVNALADHRGVIEFSEPTTEPHTGGLTMLAVVLGQVGVASGRGIVGRDLLDQVRVAVAGTQLVQRHHDELPRESLDIVCLLV